MAGHGSRSRWRPVRKAMRNVLLPPPLVHVPVTPVQPVDRSHSTSTARRRCCAWTSRACWRRCWRACPDRAPTAATAAAARASYPASTAPGAARWPCPCPATNLAAGGGPRWWCAAGSATRTASCSARSAPPIRRSINQPTPFRSAPLLSFNNFLFFSSLSVVQH